MGNAVSANSNYVGVQRVVNLTISVYLVNDRPSVCGGVFIFYSVKENNVGVLYLEKLYM